MTDKKTKPRGLGRGLSALMSDVNVDPTVSARGADLNVPIERVIANPNQPRRDFDQALSLVAGMIIGFTTPAGDEVPGMIREVGDEVVKVDFNHPLAGHELVYRVKILAVE